MKQRRIWISALGLFLMSKPGFGYDFIPTEAEFQAWPNYCKARYVSLDIGQRSKWRNQLHSSEISAARAQLGRDVFEGIHHYCTGTIFLNRARAQQDPNRKAFEFRTARVETLFTYNRLSRGTQMYVPIAVQLATIAYEMGDWDEALEVLNEVIDQEPAHELAYSAIAIIYRRQGHLEEARDILIEGSSQVSVPSAELNYNLGLILLELGDLGQAQKHAEVAYRLGYPLPGLRRKLESRGAWSTSK